MIGIFNDNFPPIMDGVAMTAKNYADNIHRHGEQVCVVTANDPKGSYNLPYPVYRYKAFVIPQRKPYRFGFPGLDPTLHKQLKDIRFNLIHAHCPFATGSLALHIARQQDIPVVATFHSKYRQDFERAIPNKWIVDMTIKRIIEFYEQADEVWIPQASVEPTLREYGYKGHVEVVENGNDFVTPEPEIIQIREQMRRSLDLGEGELMLLFVGQHIWEKNIGFILDSLALLKHLPCHLYMIGTGYAEKAIREKIRELGMDEMVTMVGSVNDRDQLKRYYAAADLFLFPSLYDNAPLVVREAAAMHTPAVMLQGSTASEIITNSDNGFLTENDIHAFAQTISHLQQHQHLIRMAGLRASQTITRSWEDIVSEVLLRYADLQLRYRRNA